MVDLSHWKYAEDFSAAEAAYLIMGSDPCGTDDGAGRFPRHIYEKLKGAYAGAIQRAEFIGFLEANLPFDRIKHAEENLPDLKTTLTSVVLEKQYLTLNEGNTEGFQGWLEYIGVTQGFDQVRFSRNELARWLRENSMVSVYQFEAPTAISEVNAEKPLATRERTNLLNIIGALLGVSGTKEAAIIAELLEKHPDTPGIKKRTLENKFAEAKRSLQSY